MRREAGFTLTEVVVAITLASVVIACGVASYSFLVSHTAKIGARSAAIVSAASALEAMRATIEGAHLCETTMLPNGTRALLCRMPNRTAYGNPAPYRIHIDGTPAYESGETYAFYFSNSTGSTNAVGNILWRARAPAGSAVFTPDTRWALYYNTGAPRYVCTPAGPTWVSVNASVRLVQVSFEIREEESASVLSKRGAGFGTQRISRRFHYRNWWQ